MWIGCDAGLYRYDGFRFMPYTNSQQNSKSISNLVLDKYQNIWCQNFTGQIFKANANSNSLEIVFDASRHSKMSPIYTVDNLGNVWIATDSLLLVLDKFQRKIKTIPTKSLGSDVNFWFDIKAFDDQTIYMTSYAGELYVINQKTYQYKRHKIDTHHNSRYKLLKLDGRVLVFTETLPERQYKITDIEGGKNEVLAKFAPLHPSGNNYIINSCQNYIMLCTSDGVVVLDKNFKRDLAFNVLFDNHKISYSYCDKEGNIWFTSLQDGIFIIPSLDVQIFNKTTSLLNDNNIPLFR